MFRKIALLLLCVSLLWFVFHLTVLDVTPADDASHSQAGEIISSREDCWMAKEALDRSFPKARREGVSLGSSEQEKLINCHWPGAELHVPDHKSTLNDYFMYNVILWVKKPRYASIPIHAVVDVSSGNWAGGDEGSCDFWKFPSGWRLTSCTYKHITY